MNKIVKRNLDTIKESIASNFEEETKRTNSLATKTYNTLADISEKITTVKDKVSVLGDMLTDLRVLNGSAKNVIYLSSLNIVEKRNVLINDDKFELNLINTNLRNISTSLSSLSSKQSYRIKNRNNKKAYLEDLLRSDEETTIEFDSTSYNFNLNLRYNNLEHVNTIVLGLGILTESYPEIVSIKYINEKNELKEATILNTNSRNYSTDENRVKDNLYTLSITPIVTSQIIIEFSTRDSTSLTFNKIKTYFYTVADEGYVILGPVQMEDPILKLAFDSTEITKGVSIEVSTNKEYWIPLTNSSNMITDKGSRKILSINTISSDSIKNDIDVYAVYFKISIKSEVLTNEDLEVSVYNTYREDSIISNDVYSLIEDYRLSAYRIRNSDFIYGNYTYSTNTNLAKLDTSMIEYIESNGASKVLGLIDTPYSITTSNNQVYNLGSIGAELRLKRVPASNIIEANTFDLSNSILYDIYLRDFEDSVNTLQKDNLCLPIKVKEDIYYITSKDSRKSISIDLTTPYTKNSSTTLIAVPNEDIEIKNSIGELIHTIQKENLLTIVDNEITYYFINLINILFSEPEVNYIDYLGNTTKQSYSLLYPLKNLDSNEYGLIRGKVVSNTYSILKVKSKEVLKTTVDTVKVVNRTNRNFLKRLDSDITYFESQFESNEDGRNVIKLQTVAVEQGSLSITNNSTVENLFTEVEYIDGVQEFLQADYTTELFPKDNNYLTLRNIPDQDSIKFSGDVTLFKKQVYSVEDLIIPSSWYLEKISDDEYAIKIHEDLRTSNFTFTYITYKAKLLSKQEGLYSVDYSNGILYLSTPSKDMQINYRKAIQYIEAQQMNQVNGEEYTNETVYNIPCDSDTKLSYIYQVKNTPAVVKSKEVLESARVSLVTLGDKDD